MKLIAREFLFNAFAMWFTSQIVPGFLITGSWLSIMEGALVLSVLTLLVKPILNILFIPINLMTLGLLSWAVNVIVIYLLTIIDLNIKIIPWVFEGLTFAGFVIPSWNVTYIASLIVTTFVLTLFVNLLHTIRD
jgi:putative membrane protein